MSITDIIKEICELQPKWTSKNTPEMKRRGELIRKDLVQALRSHEDEFKKALGKYSSDWGIKGSDGIGPKSEAPWVRIFSKKMSPSATEGYYMVIHFSADGSAVFVTIGHGSNRWSHDGSLVSFEDEELYSITERGRKLLLDHYGSMNTFTDSIRLGAKNSGPKTFEDATVVAKRFSIQNFSDEVFVSSISKSLEMLAVIYDATPINILNINMKRHNVLGMAVGCFLAAFKNGERGPMMLGLSHENDVKKLAENVLGVAPESIKNWMQEFIPYWAKSSRIIDYPDWVPSGLTGRPRKAGENRESRDIMFKYFELMPEHEMLEICKAILDLSDDPKYSREFFDTFCAPYLSKSEKKSFFTSAEVESHIMFNRLHKISKKPLGNLKPEKRKAGVAGYVFARDIDVVTWALQRSGGNCELCAKPAPFERLDGTLFLEVHHIIPLSDGGTDTVENVAAVCPNCHRACHHARNMSELSIQLANKIAKSPG